MALFEVIWKQVPLQCTKSFEQNILDSGMVRYWCYLLLGADGIIATIMAWSAMKRVSWYAKPRNLEQCWGTGMG